MKFFQTPSTVASPVSSVKPSMRHGRSHLPKNPMYRSLHATPKHREEAARNREQENHAPFSKCEEREQPKGTDKIPKASVDWRMMMYSSSAPTTTKSMNWTCGTSVLPRRAPLVIASIQVLPARAPRSVQTHPRMAIGVHHLRALIRSHLMSAQRGWARLGAVPTPSASPTSDFF